MNFNSSRPPLPTRHANPHIKSTIESGALPPVKYQILSCAGQDILVGRMKIETPTTSGHAFILRRFDTGAISLTTMFRAAFPTASDTDEKREVAWVKDTYDLLGNNGSSKEPHITRLAGTWVSPGLALELGGAYSLGAIIGAVVDAKPDPGANYRRSGKGGTPKSAASPAVSGKTSSLPTPSPTGTGGLTQPNPSKRRKESSPGPALAPIPAPAITGTGPRRSTRTKSPPVSNRSMPPLIASVIPAPSLVTSLVTVPSSTTKKSTASTPSQSQRRTRQATTQAPGGSDETAVDASEDASMEAEDGETDTLEDVASADLRREDMKEQKELIDSLKAKRMRESLPTSSSSSTNTDAKKRVHPEDSDATLVNMKFEPKEPEVGDRIVAPVGDRIVATVGDRSIATVGDRIIATNRRLGGAGGRFARLEPQQKSVAWGVAAFAFGMGAVAFLPNFF